MNVGETACSWSSTGAAKAPFPSLARVTGVGATLRLHAPGYRPVHQTLSFQIILILTVRFDFFLSANLIYLRK